MRCGIKNYKFKDIVIDMRIQEVSRLALLNTFTQQQKQKQKQKQQQKTLHKATLHLLFLLKEIYIMYCEYCL